MNEMQKCEDGPNTEPNWHTVGMFSGGKATIPGIDPGTTMRVRAPAPPDSKA